MNFWPLRRCILLMSLTWLPFSCHPLPEFLLLVNGVRDIPLGFLPFLPGLAMSL